MYGRKMYGRKMYGRKMYGRKMYGSKTIPHSTRVHSFIKVNLCKGGVNHFTAIFAAIHFTAIPYYSTNFCHEVDLFRKNLTLYPSFST